MAASEAGTEGPLLRLASGPGTAAARLASFWVTYAAILLFVVLSFQTIAVAESLLTSHFRRQVAASIRVTPANGSIVQQIENRIGRLLEHSPWTRFGDVRVSVLVFGADGRTNLYAVGRAVPPPPDMNPHQVFVDALRLLPATSEVVVSVPILSRLSAAIVVLYGAGLVTFLFLYNRALARREDLLLTSAVAARNASAERAREIEIELGRVQERLRKVEPGERAQADEIRRLESERESLRRKLEQVAEREAELRTDAARASDLDAERRALEDLLEEAVEDLGQKEREIHDLQGRLERAARGQSSRSRARAAEHLERRLRTLYKTVEFDDRIVQDLLALGDETQRLRAEEGIRRLADDPDTAAIRRKVGGLPPHLSIFELGFAGKGRIYYTRGRQQRFRVLAIGAKNSQNADLEYLSRLPAE